MILPELGRYTAVRPLILYTRAMSLHGAGLRPHASRTKFYELERGDYRIRCLHVIRIVIFRVTVAVVHEVGEVARRLQHLGRHAFDLVERGSFSFIAGHPFVIKDRA